MHRHAAPDRTCLGCQTQANGLSRLAASRKIPSNDVSRSSTHPRSGLRIEERIANRSNAWTRSLRSPSPPPLPKTRSTSTRTDDQTTNRDHTITTPLEQVTHNSNGQPHGLFRQSRASANSTNPLASIKHSVEHPRPPSEVNTSISFNSTPNRILAYTGFFNCTNNQPRTTRQAGIARIAFS